MIIVAVNFVSVLLAYNAPSICPRQNASATAYSAPNKQDGPYRTSTAVQQQQKNAMNAWRIESSTLSMTHTRNIRDDVQQAGDPSVAALCVRDQGFSDCCKL